MKKNRKRVLIAAALVLICLGVVSIVFLGRTLIWKYLGNHSQPIQNGSQTYIFPEMELEKGGFDQLMQKLTNCDNYPQKENISEFRASVDKEGKIKDFTVHIVGFDAAEEYTEDLFYVYESEDKKLTLSREVVSYKPSYYDVNLSAVYLGSQMKRIPIRAEIALLNFVHYSVEYNKTIQIEQGKPIMEGRNGEDFPLLSYDDYQRGIGGISDGKSAIVISLNDGTGPMGQRMEYFCEAIDEESIAGDKETTMQTDYYINGNQFKVTGDAGENWVDTGIGEDALEETLGIYGNAISEDSIYADGNGFFAVFYGAVPTLHISRDNGENWSDFVFDRVMPREVNRRIVHFLDSNVGYVALGTDWSMGTGSGTVLYWTHDGGASWQEVEEQDQQDAMSVDALMLTGAAFVDENNGIVTMETPDSSESWPQVFVTTDGGVSFQEMSMSWETMAADISFLNKVDRLTFENGTYTLIMGQGTYGNQKAKFTSTSLSEGWVLQETYIGTVHLDG